MSLEAVFMRAGNLRRLCQATDRSGNVHTIEPYAIFTSTKNRRCLLYYLVDSSVEAATQGWREEEAGLFTGGRLLDQSFSPRLDYDPLDKNRYPFMHYSIPTHDGRQRWMDKPSQDKSGEKLKADF